MSRPELLLSNQLCFLLYRAQRAIMDRYRPLLKRLGLTYPQYLAMLALWERREATVGELCLAISLDTGTVSPLLKRLEQAGLVTRRRSQADERSVSVGLTESGAALEEQAAFVPGALARCTDLGPEDYLKWKRELGTLLEKLEPSASELYITAQRIDAGADAGG